MRRMEEVRKDGEDGGGQGRTKEDGEIGGGQGRRRMGRLKEARTQAWAPGRDNQRSQGSTWPTLFSKGVSAASSWKRQGTLCAQC